MAFDSTLRKNISFYIFCLCECRGFFPCIGSSLVSWDFQTHQQVTPGYVERKGRPILTAGLVSLQGLDRKTWHFFRKILRTHRKVDLAFLVTTISLFTQQNRWHMKQDLISESRNLGRIFKGSWFQAFRDVLIVVGLFLRTQHFSRATWLATFWQNYPTKNPWFYEFFTGQPATKLLEHPRKDKNTWWISGNLFTGFWGIFFTWQAHHFAKIIPSISINHYIIYIYIFLVKYTPRWNNGRSLKKPNTQRKRCFLNFFFCTQNESCLSQEISLLPKQIQIHQYSFRIKEKLTDERSPTWSV